MRDDAKCARVVAALRDFDIGAVPRGETKPRGIVIRDIRRLAGDQIFRQRGGGTILGDGNVALIVDVQGLKTTIVHKNAA